MMEHSDEWKLGYVDATEAENAGCPFDTNTVEALEWHCGYLSAKFKTTWYIEKLPFNNKGLMVCVSGAHVHGLVIPIRTSNNIAHLVQLLAIFIA